MQHVILVAGVDYEFKGVDFRVFCDSRVRRLINANRAKAEMTFTIFDVRRGEVVTRVVTYPSGKRSERASTLTPSPFSAIGKANYDRTVSGGETHYRFKDNQRNTMSILDIYAALRRVGVDAPGTLRELSFFSHAWMGGPILVNSFDDGLALRRIPLVPTPVPVPVPSGARDPDDMDPRAAKDFVAPTMDAAALGQFRDAFHADGFIWIWGCAFPRLVHQILHKVERHPAYRPSGLADNVEFRFRNFNAGQADMLEDWVRDVTGPFPDKRDIKIEFRHLKLFACRITQASYSQHIADNARVMTFGGLQGTYSEYDRGRLPLMHVHRGFGRHFRFYQNYLGFDFDPEGRRYGKYAPGFTCP